MRECTSGKIFVVVPFRIVFPCSLPQIYAWEKNFSSILMNDFSSHKTAFVLEYIRIEEKSFCVHKHKRIILPYFPTHEFQGMWRNPLKSSLSQLLQRF